SQLADREAVDAAVERMRAYLAQKRPDLGRVRFDVSRDEEHDRLQIEVTTRVGVADRSTVLGFSLLESGELEELRAISRGVEALGELPFSVATVDKDGQPAAER